VLAVARLQQHATSRPYDTIAAREANLAAFRVGKLLANGKDPQACPLLKQAAQGFEQLVTSRRLMPTLNAQFDATKSALAACS
jgi:hypothetical protein